MTAPAAIPLVDLRVQHAQIADEVARGWASVIQNTSFILGPEVGDFEEAYARFLGTKHCVGVGNGGDALEFALRALGVGPGHEVIVPANTFVASALAAARVGATPVLVDCEAVHQLIDVSRVADRITPRTRVIMPVHLFGQVAAMEPLLDLARTRGIAVVEDVAQAQGARQNGTSAGAFGALGATSFYPGKNLGAYGDAGAVTTSSDELARKVRALGNYGSEVKYHHPEIGFNSRIDTLQAVVLSAKLKRLATWNDERRAAAARYDRLLARFESVGLPATMPGNEHVFHLYVVRVPKRDDVLRKLHAASVFAGVHYPCPVHLHGAFAFLGHKRGDFPVAERAANEILSLPIYFGITPEQQERVAAALRAALA